MLDEIVEACSRLCDADYGALYLLDQDLLYLVTHHGEPRSAAYDREHPHALNRTTGAGRTAVTGAPVHIPDVFDDPEYVYAGPFGYRALLGMAIKVDEGLIGVAVLVRREPRAFSDAHIALVTSTPGAPGGSLTYSFDVRASFAA
ncbi:MAG: GAF domain-containing protein [Gaiellaceae bacterium]